MSNVPRQLLCSRSELLRQRKVLRNARQGKLPCPWCTARLEGTFTPMGVWLECTECSFREV